MRIVLIFWLRHSKPIMDRYILIFKITKQKKNPKLKDKIVDGGQL